MFKMNACVACSFVEQALTVPEKSQSMLHLNHMRSKQKW